jgi:predicted Zn-dependent protease
VTPEKRLLAFQKLVADRPGEPFARYSLAMALRSAGRDDEAAREFEELRRRSPDYVPTYLMLGQVLEALGRGQEAGRIYEEGIAHAGRAHNPHAQGELRQALEILQGQG